jgi:NADH dehydrogenase FAD-containing subunit
MARSQANPLTERGYRHSGDRLRVVAAGGGVAGLEAVLTLAERAGEMLDVDARLRPG